MGMKYAISMTIDSTDVSLTFSLLGQADNSSFCSLGGSSEPSFIMSTDFRTSHAFGSVPLRLCAILNLVVLSGAIEVDRCGEQDFDVAAIATSIGQLLRDDLGQR